LAPVAIQQGRYVAKTIVQEMRGKARQDFTYRDKGQMATVGRNKAIAQTTSLKMAGFPAWLAWLFVHIYYLIGYKNKLIVLYEWAWSYFTYKRAARLILSKAWQTHVLTQVPAASVSAP